MLGAYQLAVGIGCTHKVKVVEKVQLTYILREGIGPSDQQLEKDTHKQERASLASLLLSYHHNIQTCTSNCTRNRCHLHNSIQVKSCDPQ